MMCNMSRCIEHHCRGAGGRVGAQPSSPLALLDVDHVNDAWAAGGGGVLSHPAP